MSIVVDPKDIHSNPTSLVDAPFVVRGTRVGDGKVIVEYHIDFPATSLSFTVSAAAGPPWNRRVTSKCVRAQLIDDWIEAFVFRGFKP